MRHSPLPTLSGARVDERWMTIPVTEFEALMAVVAAAKVVVDKSGSAAGCASVAMIDWKALHEALEYFA